MPHAAHMGSTPEQLGRQRGVAQLDIDGMAFTQVAETVALWDSEAAPKVRDMATPAHFGMQGKTIDFDQS